MPEAPGGAFYDQPGVLARYTSPPGSGVSSPNAVMEEPALLAELGDVAAAHVLDLGCGDAAVGERLLAAGARSYLGIDASARMVQLASQRVTPLGGQIRLAAIETFDAESGSADLVISRLALHYLEDVTDVFARARRWLAPGGQLIVTVLHPVITSHDARNSTDQLRTNWTVDNYFAADPGRSAGWAATSPSSTARSSSTSRP